MNSQTASLIPLSVPKIKFFLGENRFPALEKTLHDFMIFEKTRF